MTTGISDYPTLESTRAAASTVPLATPGLRSAPNLNALTGLRFFAAMGVVLYHFALPILKGGSWPGSAPFANLIGSGYIAVDLFYLLSGFILTYSYLGSEDTQHGSVRGSLRGTRRAFYVSRFARIYPAYFIAFLLAAPSDIVTTLQVNHFTTAVAKLALNGGTYLTLLQAWTPWTAWSWNFPAWSISVEAFFYLVFPFVALRLARLTPAATRTTAAVLWILGLVAPFLLWRLKGTTGPPELGDHLQMFVEFNPLLRLPEFLLGILLGKAYLRGSFRTHGGLLSAVAALLLVALLAFCSFVPHPLLANGLLAPIFALLIVGLAQGRGPIAWLLSLPVLVVLGEASYSMYILQVPIALALRRPPPYHSLRLLVVYCGALILASLLTWRYIETPLRSSLRRRLA